MSILKIYGWIQVGCMLFKVIDSWNKTFKPWSLQQVTCFHRGVKRELVVNLLDLTFKDIAIHLYSGTLSKFSPCLMSLFYWISIFLLLLLLSLLYQCRYIFLLGTRLDNHIYYSVVFGLKRCCLYYLLFKNEFYIIMFLILLIKIKWGGKKKLAYRVWIGLSSCLLWLLFITC